MSRLTLKSRKLRHRGHLISHQIYVEIILCRVDDSCGRIGVCRRPLLCRSKLSNRSSGPDDLHQRTYDHAVVGHKKSQDDTARRTLSQEAKYLEITASTLGLVLPTSGAKVCLHLRFKLSTLRGCPVVAGPR